MMKFQSSTERRGHHTCRYMDKIYIARMLHLGKTVLPFGCCEKGELCLYITPKHDRSTRNCTWHALELMLIYACRCSRHGSNRRARKVDGEDG